MKTCRRKRDFALFVRRAHVVIWGVASEFILMKCEGKPIYTNLLGLGLAPTRYEMVGDRVGLWLLLVEVGEKRAKSIRLRPCPKPVAILQGGLVQCWNNRDITAPNHIFVKWLIKKDQAEKLSRKNGLKRVHLTERARKKQRLFIAFLFFPLSTFWFDSVSSLIRSAFLPVVVSMCDLSSLFRSFIYSSDFFAVIPKFFTRILQLACPKSKLIEGE